MNQQELVNWLFENGGPAIRYRTATELMPTSDSVDIGRLAEELLQSELVRTWLGRLIPATSLNGLHGSKATAFENVMGKLTDLGLMSGVPELDQRTRPFRRWLEDNAKRPPRHIFDIFIRTLIAAFLARAGYINEPAVGIVLKNRLETVYDFTRRGRYDIYVSQADYPKMPRSFRSKPLIDPALTSDGNVCLPWIYDIIGLTAYLPDRGTEDDWTKTNTVINYILNSQYQKLPRGYGVLRAENGRYRAMGWSVHLPGFLGNPSEDSSIGMLVQRLSLMAQFPVATQHSWFMDSLRHLGSFQTERGTYLFPRSYLQEDSVGYWVVGRRMGLEESRRTRLAFELESTFWMTKLLTSVRAEVG